MAADRAMRARAHPSRRGWIGLTAAVALVAGSLGGCALSPERSPQALDKRGVPYGLMSPGPPPKRAPFALDSQRVVIYLESASGHLVAVHRRVPRPANVSSVLGQLAQGPTVAESGRGLASPASAVGPITSRGLGNGVLSVNLPTSFQALDGDGQMVAAAQIVFSVTTFASVRGVVFYVGGQRAQVPEDNGSLSSGPSTRAEYKAFLG